MARTTARGRPTRRDSSGFTRILVPFDLTARSTRAFETACRLAGAGGEVTLLHVIEVIRGLPMAELEGFYRKLERRAKKAMVTLAGRAPNGMRVVIRITVGSRAEEIVRVAAAARSNLIVLGSHKVRPASLMRDWGTISYKVGLMARCPVLLIK